MRKELITYLCGVGDFSQHPFSTSHNKSLSSFSHSGSSGMVFLLHKAPTFYAEALLNINRSVFKAFDCVGLTKPQSTSKLSFFCYLRFYAAILSNVVKLTTLKKQTQMVFSQYLKWQLICKSSIDNKPAFCLVSVVKKDEKNFVFCSPSFLKGIFYYFFC